MKTDGSATAANPKHFLQGFVLAWTPLVAVFLIPDERYKLLAGGLGLIWLFALRRVWIPHAVRFAYSGRWTRLLLWPLSAGTEEACVSILRALTWLWLVAGLALAGIALTLLVAA